MKVQRSFEDLTDDFKPGTNDHPNRVQTAASGAIDTLAWLVGDGADTPPAALGERGAVVPRAVAQRRRKTAIEAVEEFTIGGLVGLAEGLLFALTFGLLDLEDAESHSGQPWRWD